MSNIFRGVILYDEFGKGLNLAEDYSRSWLAWAAYSVPNGGTQTSLWDGVDSVEFITRAQYGLLTTAQKLSKTSRRFGRYLKRSWDVELVDLQLTLWTS